MNKAFFLDRDGVINLEKDYVYQKHEFEFHQGVFDACRMINSHGYKIIVVTNQSGIGRGYYTEVQFLDLNQWMLQTFEAQGVCISDVYFCPHHRLEGIEEYKFDCDNRKPKPGMILKGARDHNIDLSCSVLVGDRMSDITAGARAGINNLFLVGTQSTVEVKYNVRFSDSLFDVVKTYFNELK